jgi:hypothetical protein
MPTPLRPAAKTARAAVGEVGHDAVACQLDDLNALAEALAAALNDRDDGRIASVRESMHRYRRAMGWNAAGVLPAVIAYAAAHAGIADELFAPAFVLRAIAPEHPKAVAVVEKLSADAAALLTRALAD